MEEVLEGTEKSKERQIFSLRLQSIFDFILFWLERVLREYILKMVDYRDMLNMVW